MVHQLIIKSKITKQYFLHLYLVAGQRGWCLPEQGLSVKFTQRRTNLKIYKVLVKPSFSKSEWVTDWSNLMITVLQVVYPLH